MRDPDLWARLNAFVFDAANASRPFSAKTSFATFRARSSMNSNSVFAAVTEAVGG